MEPPFVHLLQIQRTLSQVWACVRQHSVETCHECEGREGGGVPTAAATTTTTTTTTALHQHQKKQKCQTHHNLSPIKSSFFFSIWYWFFCRTQFFDLPNPCRHDDKTGVMDPRSPIYQVLPFEVNETWVAICDGGVTLGKKGGWIFWDEGT